MRPLRWPILASLAVVTAIGMAVLSALTLDRGATPTAVPWSTVVVGNVLGGVLLWAGWTLRQFKAGKRPALDPTRAMRTAMLAQACAYAGALLAGAYGGYALALARDWSQEPRRELAIGAAIAALGGLVMVAAGGVAEWWCRIGKNGDDDPGAPGPEPGVAH